MAGSIIGDNKIIARMGEKGAGSSYNNTFGIEKIDAKTVRVTLETDNADTRAVMEYLNAHLGCKFTFVTLKMR